MIVPRESVHRHLQCDQIKTVSKVYSRSTGKNMPENTLASKKELHRMPGALGAVLLGATLRQEEGFTCKP